ncbi:MAG: glycogen synthase GlgA [Hyphomicrobiales bacterium]|nr:glycogen synthase GlgA [Hyphomicrobiales bacterium]
MSDFLQAGGLGAVSASLPRALRRHSDIRVLLPGYRAALEKAGPLEIVAKLPGLAAVPPCSIGATTLDDGLVVNFVLCDELYRRDGSPYADPSGADFADNDLRFARLSLAAAQLAVQGCGGWRPTCLHLNDWQSALAAGYLAWSGADVPVLLTIHNLAHQGLFDASRIGALGVPEAAFTMEGVEFFGRLSFLKAGLNHASHIVTVSENYAREITRPEFGCGLDGLLAERAAEGRLAGIVNGIDETWDPRHDRKCPYLYDAQRWKGRYADYVRGVFGLSLARAPLFAFVSRLVHQKGADLVLQAAQRIVSLGGQLAVMGRGEARVEAAFAALAAQAPEAVGARIGFDPDGARAMFAGADFILMPSRFEPCGLSQMYAQRFGAIPIATRTGGLSETIRDGETGFLIDRPAIGDLEPAIDLAFAVYGTNKRLAELRRAAMSLKFDWDESAGRYGALYRSLEGARGARTAISLPALR